MREHPIISSFIRSINQPYLESIKGRDFFGVFYEIFAVINFQIFTI